MFRIIHNNKETQRGEKMSKLDSMDMRYCQECSDELNNYQSDDCDSLCDDCYKVTK